MNKYLALWIAILSILWCAVAISNRKQTKQLNAQLDIAITLHNRIEVLENIICGESNLK